MECILKMKNIDETAIKFAKEDVLKMAEAIVSNEYGYYNPNTEQVECCFCGSSPFEEHALDCVFLIAKDILA